MKSMLNAIRNRSLEFIGSALVGLGIIGFAFSAILVFNACSWPWDEGAEGISVLNTTLYSFAIRGLAICAGIFALGIILISPRMLLVIAFPLRFMRRKGAVGHAGPADLEEAAAGEKKG